jgi:hypothetical protein
VGAGIIGGLGLILVEILYHKHKIRKEKRADAAQMAITKWKGTIEVVMKFYREMSGKSESLKGPKLELFGSGFYFTQIRPVWVGSLVT